MSFQKISSIILQQGANLSQVIIALNKLLGDLNALVGNFIGKPQFASTILTKVSLNTGLNQVPHTLNKQITGWQVIRLRGPASFYDTQDVNPAPDVYLYLNSSVACEIDLLVF